MELQDKHFFKTKNLVLTALLFAIAIVLSILENMLPPIPIPVPFVKFGLSNIAVMYALFFLKGSNALMIALLKAIFAAVTRGAIAGILSLSGGILSLIVMILLMHIFKHHISYFILSIFGALSHNLGQFIMVSLLYSNMNLWLYLPVLLFTGLIAGIITAILLRFILPAFKMLG